MKVDLNLGIAKTIVKNKLTNEFLAESKIQENKGLMNDFIKMINESPILIKEYGVINNIETNHIQSEVIASKFIDNNIGLFSKYSSEEINEAHKSLENFISEDSIKDLSEDQIKLYNSIGVLIEESNSSDGNPMKIHESYEYILNYLKEDKNQEEDNTDLVSLDENYNIDSIVDIATKRYNEKYSSLNENEKKIVTTIVNGDSDQKKELFESIRKDNIEKLKSLDSNGIEDKINEAIEKMNNMVYAEENIVEDIVNLTNLNNNLN